MKSNTQFGIISILSAILSPEGLLCSYCKGVSWDACMHASPQYHFSQIHKWRTWFEFSLFDWKRLPDASYYNAIVTLISIDDVLQHTHSSYSVQYPCGGKRGFARAMLSSSAMARSMLDWLFYFYNPNCNFYLLTWVRLFY